MVVWDCGCLREWWSSVHGLSHVRILELGWRWWRFFLVCDVNAHQFYIFVALMQLYLLRWYVLPIVVSIESFIDTFLSLRLFTFYKRVPFIPRHYFYWIIDRSDGLNDQSLTQSTAMSGINRFCQLLIASSVCYLPISCDLAAISRYQTIVSFVKIRSHWNFMAISHRVVLNLSYWHLMAASYLIILFAARKCLSLFLHEWCIFGRLT